MDNEYLKEPRFLRNGGALLRVARLEADSFDQPVDVDGLIAAAQRQGLDVLTLVQTIPHVQPLFSFHMEWDNVAALPVSTFDHWWHKQVDRKTRNIVRKSEKQGVEVAEAAFDDDMVAAIHQIYNECPIRHGKRFWHYGKDLSTVRRENASFAGRSVFLKATCGGEPVGFAKIVVSNDGQQARLMQILAMVAHRDKSPTNALIAEAIRVCERRGIGNLCYGSFSYGKKQRDSLADFKENNGFKRIEVPRYFIPLNARGRIGMKLGLHRRFIDQVPEPILLAFRDARRRWYSSAKTA